MSFGELDPLNACCASLERELDRRRFLTSILLAGIAPATGLDGGQRRFLAGMASHLIPAEAFRLTGVDVAENIEYMLSRGSGERREKILRLLAWSQRISFLYGGDQIAVRAARSRFILMRKMAKALSSLCLVAFWGDERTLQLIENPKGAP